MEAQSSEAVGLPLDLKLRRECVCIPLNGPLWELCSTITAGLAVLLAPSSDAPPQVFCSALQQDSSPATLNVEGFDISCGSPRSKLGTGNRSCVFQLFVTAGFSRDEGQTKTEDKLLRPRNP